VFLRVVVHELLDVGLDPGDLGQDLVGRGGPHERCGVCCDHLGAGLLGGVFQADLAAFGVQVPELATR
jgi:hypothetical protein